MLYIKNNKMYTMRVGRLTKIIKVTIRKTVFEYRKTENRRKSYAITKSLSSRKSYG